MNKKQPTRTRSKRKIHSHNGNLIFLVVVIIVVAVVANIYINMWSAQPTYSTDKTLAATNPDDEILSKAVIEKLFSAQAGKSYAQAKKDLAAQGWAPYIPENADIGGEPWSSAGDTDYPEIGWCGSGRDAMCFVNFKKGPNTAHLDVFNPTEDGAATGWKVVGIE